jgi:hypothetical protein
MRRHCCADRQAARHARTGTACASDEAAR